MPDQDTLKIVAVTTDFMDNHVATCQKKCAICSMYQRSEPEEFERAIARGLANRGRFN